MSDLPYCIQHMRHRHHALHIRNQSALGARRIANELANAHIAVVKERDDLKARVAELEAHPTITRETLIADVIAQETPEEQARAIWWLRDVADEAADTLGLTYAEPCAGDGCDGVALDSTESALCAECAPEAGGTQ